MNNKTLSIVANVLSVLSMCAGIFGMLFSFFFMWSSRIEDIVASGFPFLAGAVLFGTGLIAFTIVNKSK